MRKRNPRFLLSALIAVAFLLIALGSTRTVAAPTAAAQCVNQTGTNCDAACNGCYASIQAAVDAATSGDTVRIAGGSYTDPGGTVISITNQVTVIGGWDPTCDSHAPEIYPVVLDAQRMGSVVVVDSAGEVWLSYLILTGGNGTGNCYPSGCGGGIYAANTNLYLHHATIIDNWGHISGTGVISPAGALGGGIYATNGVYNISHNRILSNTAGDGGYYSYGGGVFIYGSAVELLDNEIADNLGSVDYSGSGGVHLYTVSYARVLSNTIRDNESNRGDGWSEGGGLKIDDSSDVIVADNVIEGNVGGQMAGIGGGVSVIQSDAHLTRNVIVNNTGGSMYGQGDGVSIRSSLPVTLSNNLIAYNRSGSASEGVYVELLGSPPSTARLFNNTLVGNGERGVVASQFADVTLVNNIIADHEIGIVQTHPASSIINADHNLLWNGSNPISGTNAILGDPLLASTYYPRGDSPALNAGADVVWLTEDLDHNLRPQEGNWDIGAFEGARWYTWLPLALKGGGPSGILFFDDFQDGTLTGWMPNHGLWVNPVGENAIGYYPLGNAWNIYEPTGDNFAYEGTVNLVDGNAAGLTFRSSADGTSSYDVIIDAVDGAFKISRRPPYQILDSYSMTIQRGHPYRIRVEADGNMIYAFLDGAHLLTASDTTYAAGHFGVILFQATATYDDIIAWEVP